RAAAPRRAARSAATGRRRRTRHPASPRNDRASERLVAAGRGRATGGAHRLGLSPASQSLGGAGKKAPGAPGNSTGLSKPSAERAETPKNQSSMLTPFRVSEVAAPASRLWVQRKSVVSRHQTR